MSEMVERVAKAICAEAVGFDADFAWSYAPENICIGMPLSKDEYRDMARAAIREMREPTEAMRDRYNDPEIVGYGPDGSDHDKVWQAGVDAALIP